MCGAARGLLGLSRSLLRPVLRRVVANHTHQAFERRRLFRNVGNSETRAPSIGRDARSCDRVELLRDPFHVLAISPRTRSPGALKADPSRVSSSRAVLPRHSSDCLAAHLDVTWKMLPTDFCNRLSTRAPASVAWFSRPRLPPKRKPQKPSVPAGKLPPLETRHGRRTSLR